MISVEAPAKLNLTFELLGLMPDSYHRVKTLMQTITLSDRLTFDICQARDPAIHIDLSSTGSGVAADFPLTADNLIAKAIRLYLSSLPDTLLPPLKVSVQVEKNIPIGAGMAGGSGNAAAALLAMNHYLAEHGKALSRAELIALGARLGADVPFSIMGATAVGTGRGDRLEPVDTALSSHPLHFVIAKHRYLHVATPAAYKSYDDLGDTLGLSERLKDRGIADDATDYAASNLASVETYADAFKAFGNDFEQAIFPQYRELKELKQRLLAAGAEVCHMTGSGPTIYAVCRSHEAAIALKETYERDVARDRERDIVCATKVDPVDLYVCSTTTHGAKIL